MSDERDPVIDTGAIVKLTEELIAESRALLDDVDDQLAGQDEALEGEDHPAS